MHALMLRVMTWGDVAAVLALERAVPEAPHWDAAVYYDAVEGAIERGGATAEKSGAVRRLMVAVVAGEDGTSEMLAGFAGAQVVRPAPAAGDEAMQQGAIGELETIAVRPELRRGGVGRALCMAMIAWMREVGAESVELEVRASSVGALALYRSLGFVEQGRRRGYYAAPAEDAVLMKKCLADGLR